MIPDSFYYRVEVIDSARSMATYEDVSNLYMCKYLVWLVSLQLFLKTFF